MDAWKESFPSALWEESIYRLGNLTLLESTTNRRFDNTAYAESGYALTRSIPEIAPKQWTPLAPAVVRSLEEAGNQLLTFYEFPRAMWKSIRTTNALENLNREFRRRTKTQASFSSEESAVALLFGLIASGQIQLRRIDGYQRLSEVLEHAEVAA